MRCKFIIKLDKPFGFDPESKTPDSARRFFFVLRTLRTAGGKDVYPFDYGKTDKMDFRFVSDLVSILTHFFIKNRMKPMTAVGTKTEMNCFFRIASSENPYGRAIPKLT